MPPTPAEEIEQEARQPGLVDKTGAPLGRFAALRAARQANQAPSQAPPAIGPIVHTKEVAAVVESAYKQFLLLGHGPETARSLANTYGLLELTLELNRIATRFLGDGK